jgi:hypothetical protein
MPQGREAGQGRALSEEGPFRGQEEVQPLNLFGPRRTEHGNKEA